jgi:4-oxalocrotonate tautomerase
MIQKLTDAMVSIEGEKLRSLTWVVIEEVKDGNLGGSRYRAETLVSYQAGRS